MQGRRFFASSSSETKTEETDNTPITDVPATEPINITINADEDPVIYRGALAEATLRLKRVSITTCVLGLVGMPLLCVLYGSDVAATGQLAVGGTAIFAATGSTAALTYCISPYVHLLEKVEVDEDDALDNESESTKGSASGHTQVKKVLLQATTRDIFAREKKTIFDPASTDDVSHNVGSRPFCNFKAKDVAMYVHPELIEDEVLREQLVGNKALERLQQAKKDADKSKKEDDDFL
jgi:hypothetical protein